jgi:Flp pilus assembly protein TadG
MKRSSSSAVVRRRVGAVAVEAAVVMSVLLLFLFGLLDLGLATARYDVLSAAARDVARAAIVRGGRAAPDLTSWGPATYSGNAADSSEIAETAATVLATMAPADVTVQVSWPDGDNEEGDRVQVVLQYVHQGLSLLGLGNGLTLRSQSTMQIVH